MKEQKGKKRRRILSGRQAGGILLCVLLICLTTQSLTVAGKEKSAAPKEKIRFGNQTQRYPVVSQCAKGRQEDYIKLTLSGITGERDEAAPEMEGKKSGTCYIRKQRNSQGGFSSAACSYDVPVGWKFGSNSWEPCLEAVWPDGSDAEVYIHITENRMFPGGVGKNWAVMQKKIKESAQKTKGVSFSGFRFERYLREDERELLFYSFCCTVNGEKVQYAIAYVMGETYLAEFIGSCPVDKGIGETESADYAIEEITRYMAASFVETKEEKNFDQLKYRQYMGYENWAYEDLHNPFAMAAYLYAPEKEPRFTGENKELTFASEEWEDLLRTATGYYRDMSDAEWESFCDRPLCAADVAWITEVTMTESPIPGRDEISVGGLRLKDADCAEYSLSTLQDIAVLPNLQKLTLEIGGVSDYEVLKECRSLTELTLVTPTELQDADWLCELPNLKSLTLRISMFSYLNEMGYEKDGGSTFQKDKNGETGSGGEKEAGPVSDGTWERILKKCTKLEYLELEHPGMMEFDFLNALPNLYTFCLYGEERDSQAAEVRRAVFGESACPQVKCLVVDESWIRNPG